MPQPLEKWTVLPHSRVVELDTNILTVTGSLEMPLVEVPRRMTVVRLQDGRLVIYSAIALDEPEMAALEKYGRPAFLVVPGELHRMDAKIWKDRYPNLRVLAPEGAREKVEEVVPVDATQIDLGDPNVVFMTVPGTDGHEAALIARTPRGTTLIVNDLIWNLQSQGGFGGWMMKLMGFVGDAPRIPGIVKSKVVRNAEALRQQLVAWSRLDSLRCVLVSHGDPIDHDPAGTLRGLAAGLA